MVKLAVILIAAIAVATNKFCSVCGQKIDYSRWRWLELTGECITENSVHSVIDQIEDDPHLNFLEHRDGVLSFLASPEYKLMNGSVLSNEYCQTRTIYNDLENLLSHERPQRSSRRLGRGLGPSTIRHRRRTTREEDFYDRYVSNEEMEYLYEMLAMKYPNTLSKKIIGKSSEGRDIVMFIVSSGQTPIFECQKGNENQSGNEKQSGNENEIDPESPSYEQNRIEARARHLDVQERRYGMRDNKDKQRPARNQRFRARKRLRGEPKVDDLVRQWMRQPIRGGNTLGSSRSRGKRVVKKRRIPRKGGESRIQRDIGRIRQPIRDANAFGSSKSQGKRVVRMRKISGKGEHSRIPRDADAETDSHSHIPLNLGTIFGAHQKRKENAKTSRKINKPIIFIESGAHSREWIAPAATLYLISRLARQAHLSSDVEFRIVPMLNPDGYIYSQEVDRMWRKTRSKTSNPKCFGADLNRNFGNHWGEVDTTTNPCKSYYGGTNEFSEPEARAVRDHIYTIRHRIKAYFTLHNWGQEIMYPFSYTDKQKPINEKELMTHGNGMSDAIRDAQRVNYTVGMSSIRLYPASGTSSDWALETMKIPIAYTIELRDVGKRHFLMPEEEIRPTGKDLLAAMTYMSKTFGEEARQQCNHKE